MDDVLTFAIGHPPPRGGLAAIHEFGNAFDVVEMFVYFFVKDFFVGAEAPPPRPPRAGIQLFPKGHRKGRIILSVRASIFPFIGFGQIKAALGSPFS